jgi:hypothetical protein
VGYWFGEDRDVQESDVDSEYRQCDESVLPRHIDCGRQQGLRRREGRHGVVFD